MLFLFDSFFNILKKTTRFRATSLLGVSFNIYHDTAIQSNRYDSLWIFFIFTTLRHKDFTQTQFCKNTHFVHIILKKLNFNLSIFIYIYIERVNDKT